MMSLHRLSAGVGYRYLLKDTACGDVERAMGDPLTDYYLTEKAPAGRWLGRGLAGLHCAASMLNVGDVVTESQMAHLYGSGNHPLTGETLTGTRPSPDGAKRVVAGFDLTFTVPKSASVLWALGDRGTHMAVADAHNAAVTDLLAIIEERALFTRTGHAGVMQVETRGMIAAAFDHWDTRHGDPNLHSHVVIANRVQGLDGKWRTIDSKALHLAAVAVSELYDNVFADHLAARLPVRWGFRSRGHARPAAHEITGLSDQLLAAFSTRSASISEELVRLGAKFHADHGRKPNRVEVVKLRQQATLMTRPPKTARPLGELLTRWADTARRLTGRTPSQITADALAADPDRALSNTQISEPAVARLSQQVGEGLLERRATFTEWNIWAEASRVTRGLRMTSVRERIQLVERIVTTAKASFVPLDAPQLITVPEQLRRADGSSLFTRAGEARFAHPRLMVAEEELLAANSDLTAPSLPMKFLTPPPTEARPDCRPVRQITDGLAPDQLEALRQISTSGRRVDVLVGPAGAGKTTALAALREAWERGFGQGSVIGLAPSANAAHELGDALGIPAENTAKWLHETVGDGAHHRQATLDELALRREQAISAGDRVNLRRIDATTNRLAAEARSWQLRPGQLLIIDEASLAGTLDLSTLAAQAREAHAKVLLVGDHAQLGAVTAGGGFGLLARTGTASHLHSLWRFNHPWEAQATRKLRIGDPTAIEAYTAADRLGAGTIDEMVDLAYTAWSADRASGRTSVLIAADNETVGELNKRAHAEAVASGTATGTAVRLGGDCEPERGEVRVGDTIVTRRNNRLLRLPDGEHVRNGTLWTVTAVHADGSLTATPTGTGSGTGPRLPPEYVADHVDLGYATTAHRAQGMTVDTAHTIATPGTGREALYVAMTRGRDSNHAYLVRDAATDECQPQLEPAMDDPASMMARILANTQAELSATEAIATDRASARSLATLGPVRGSLAALIDADVWPGRLCAAGLSPAVVHAITDSPRAGGILTALRRGDDLGHNMAHRVSELAATIGGDHPAHEIPEAIHRELATWLATAPDLSPAGTRSAARTLGLTDSSSRAEHPLRDALDQVDQLIEARMAELAAANAASTGTDPTADIEVLIASMDAHPGPNSYDNQTSRNRQTQARIAQARIENEGRRIA